MNEKIIVRHRVKRKCGRKLKLFTPDMMAIVVDLTERGMHHDKIAKFLGMAPVTLSRKIAELPEFQTKITRIKQSLPANYTKKDTEYWDALITQGAINRRLRNAKHWAVIRVMREKEVGYRKVLDCLEMMLGRSFSLEEGL